MKNKPLGPSFAHHSANSDQFIEFMKTGWKADSGETPKKISSHEYFAARRLALSKSFPEDTLIIPSGEEKVRSNDSFYRFRPSSDFYYLTGNVDPDCILVLKPDLKGKHSAILFVRQSSWEDGTFFSDPLKGELWVGPRVGVKNSKMLFGVDECYSNSKFSEFVRSLPSPVRLLRGHSSSVDDLIAANDGDSDLAQVLAEMRLIKDEFELAELGAAIDSTRRGFEDVIARIRSAECEREVEGIFNLRARVEGNDVGYGTIAASGPRSCVLHWTKNNGKLKKGQLLLLDAGVERESLYTADITRTVPISGKFTREQRAVYDLVYNAQQAAINAVKPGNDFMEPNRVAMQVFAAGLGDLGITDNDKDQFYRRYTMHNVSHMLGLDVHDCAKARQESYKFGKLLEGMVLTVEPGLYFQPNDLTVPERFRGIGIRIEDDIVVTKTGFKNLSKKIPSRSSDVEAWMAKIRRG